MKTLQSFLFGWMLLILGCQSDRGKDKLLPPNINSIDDFNKYKDLFDITEVRKINIGSTKNSLLFFYESSCNFKCNKDSILKVEAYNIIFRHTSNTSIDIVTFASDHYANFIARQLEPYVRTVRHLKDKEQDKFCLPYYLSRIYNFAIIKNKIYLFGYDAYMASSGNITIDSLRYLDKVCAALKQ